MAFIYDLTDTWNASGTTFNAIKMNVTDTASAAASRLLTLQVGGAERFGIDKAGNVLIGNGGDLQISSATGGNNSTFYNDAQDLYITTNGTARMYINSSGDVGVGNTSPGTKLDVTGNIRLSAPVPVIEWNSGGAQVYAPAANSLAIATGGGIGSPVERLRVDSSGNVGIGVTPSTRLDVAGTSRYTFNVANAYTLLTSLNAAGSAFADAYTNGLSHIWQTSGSERMRITSAGNVGIGTSSPSQKLHVSGATLTVPSAGWTSGQVAYNYLGDTNNGISATNGGDTNIFGFNGITFSSTGFGGEKMRIVSDGAVGIGLSAPNATLHLQGIKGGNGRMTQSSTGGTSQDNLNLIASSNGSGGDQWFSYGVSSANYYFIQNGVSAGSSGLVIRNDNRVMVGTATGFDATVGANFMAFGSAGSAAAFKVDGSSTTQVSFYDNTQSARVGWIGTASSTTSYNTTSDRRLKKNIQPVGDVGDKIDQMEVVTHQWTNGTEAVIPYGFIAQDLHKIAPHAVSAGDEGEEVVVEWAVDYSKLVPMLVKEVQSLRARVAQLEGN